MLSVHTYILAGEMHAVDVWAALRIEGQGQLHVFSYHNQNCINAKV